MTLDANNNIKAIQHLKEKIKKFELQINMAENFITSSIKSSSHNLEGEQFNLSIEKIENAKKNCKAMESATKKLKNYLDELETIIRNYNKNKY